MAKIDAVEIERTDFLHAELDKAAAGYLKVHPSYDSELGINDVGVMRRYTADEVRSWPALKARMVVILRSAPPNRTPLAFITGNGCVDYYSDGDGLDWLRLRSWNGDYRSVDRGLYMTTEHQAFKSAKSSADLAPTLRGIDPASDAPAEFKATAQRFNDTQIAALTEALPANQAARQRMVAALAAELARPVTARFPAESRQDRALPVSNGGRR